MNTDIYGLLQNVQVNETVQRSWFQTFKDNPACLVALLGNPFLTTNIVQSLVDPGHENYVSVGYYELGALVHSCPDGLINLSLEHIKLFLQQVGETSGYVAFIKTVSTILFQNPQALTEIVETSSLLTSDVMEAILRQPLDLTSNETFSALLDKVLSNRYESITHDGAVTLETLAVNVLLQTLPDDPLLEFSKLTTNKHLLFNQLQLPYVKLSEVTNSDRLNKIISVLEQVRQGIHADALKLSVNDLLLNPNLTSTQLDDLVKNVLSYGTFHKQLVPKHLKQYLPKSFRLTKELELLEQKFVDDTAWIVATSVLEEPFKGTVDEFITGILAAIQ